MLALRELQERFFAALTRPHGAAAAGALDPVLADTVRRQGKLDAAERVEIYARMYCARLVDALAEDFPRMTVLLGEARFDEIAHAYVAACPSTHPSLRHVGRRFAALLASLAKDGHVPPFLPDLARLEWARVEVFDAADAEPLGSDDLRAIPPSAWPGLRLALVPALRVLQVAWPVHRIWADAAAEGGTPASALAEDGVLRVWRDRELTVHQARMDAIEWAALSRMTAGEPFAAVCEAVAAAAPEHAAREAGALLLRWAEDGILARAFRGGSAEPLA
jgi:hypothetical protein